MSTFLVHSINDFSNLNKWLQRSQPCQGEGPWQAQVSDQEWLRGEPWMDLGVWVFLGVFAWDWEAGKRRFQSHERIQMRQTCCSLQMFTKVTIFQQSRSQAPFRCVWEHSLGLTTWFSQVLLHLYAEAGFKNHRVALPVVNGQFFLGVEGFRIQKNCMFLVGYS